MSVNASRTGLQAPLKPPTVPTNVRLYATQQVKPVAFHIKQILVGGGAITVEPRVVKCPSVPERNRKRAASETARVKRILTLLAKL